MGKRTISIGGATYDLFVHTGNQVVETCNARPAITLPLGEKVRVNGVVETCGGGASNTSIGLSRLGCNAGFLGVIGSDQWGEKLLENLRNENVDTRSTVIVEDEMTSFSIILSASSGERVILYESGTNDHLHDANFQKETVADVDWVYLNHIQENSCVIQDDIIDILASDDTVKFTWNPGGCQIDAGMNEQHNRQLLSHTDMLQLNREEAFRFTKLQDIEDALRTLSKAGAAVVCITDGSNGTLATDGEKIYHCPILSDVKPKDTTGAGDSFGTAVTWALVEGLDLSTALQAGTINAASVVSSIGAQAGLLTDIEMRRQLESSSLAVSVTSLS